MDNVKVYHAADDAPFFVWRRDDGYVGCTRYAPRDFVGSNGKKTSFEHIGVFKDWSDACEAISLAATARFAPAG